MVVQLPTDVDTVDRSVRRAKMEPTQAVDIVLGGGDGNLVHRDPFVGNP